MHCTYGSPVYPSPQLQLRPSNKLRHCALTGQGSLKQWSIPEENIIHVYKSTTFVETYTQFILHFHYDLANEHLKTK